MAERRDAPYLPGRRSAAGADSSIMPLSVAHDAGQPLLDRDTDFLGSGKRQRALETGGDVGAETNLDPERLRRPWFDPGPDDQQPGAIACHGPALGLSVVTHFVTTPCGVPTRWRAPVTWVQRRRRGNKWSGSPMRPPYGRCRDRSVTAVGGRRPTL